MQLNILMFYLTDLRIFHGTAVDCVFRFPTAQFATLTPNLTFYTHIFCVFVAELHFRSMLYAKSLKAFTVSAIVCEPFYLSAWPVPSFGIRITVVFVATGRCCFYCILENADAAPIYPFGFAIFWCPKLKILLLSCLLCHLSFRLYCMWVVLLWPLLILQNTHTHTRGIFNFR